MSRLLLGLGVLAWLGLPSAAPAAQTLCRVLVAPPALSLCGHGPTQHDNDMLFEQREE